MRNLGFAIISAALAFSVLVFGIGSFLKSDATNDDVQNEVYEAEERTEEDAEDVGADFLKSYDKWYAYSKANIDLMTSFKAQDEKGGSIGKGVFLNLLRTGAYAPKKESGGKNIVYGLVPLKKNFDTKIKDSVKSLAKNAYRYFRMEGKRLPEYNFIDLNGVSYNREDTKGKLLVLKCWFITCKVCVEEFPELNKLVDKYKKENVSFVSLAFDEKDKLVEFLKTKTFKYPTIPLQKDYMAKKLKINQYPTHLIVDSNGVIIKMVNNVKTLSYELDRIMNKLKK